MLAHMSKYTLQRTAMVLGLAGAMMGTSLTAAQISVPGFLKFEAYPGTTGTAVSGLLGDPNYPDAPAETLYMTTFDTRTVYPNDSHENYGARVSGFVTPAEDGDYEFFIRSDDAGILFLSSDADPGNLVQVAVETACCDAFHETGAPETSLPQTLAAGQKYAIQVLYKEGGGGDYAQVAWRKVGDPIPAGELRPISGAFLSAMIEEGGTVTITQQPINIAAAENDYITLKVGVNFSAGPVVVQWQREGQNIPNLTGSAVTYGPLKLSDNGAKFRAVVSIPGAVATSAEAILTVTKDITKPTLRRLFGSDTFDKVTMEFSEPITDASAANPASYQLDNGLAVTEVLVISPTQVRLTTTPQTSATVYKLTLVGIEDTAGNQNAVGYGRTFTAFTRIPGGLKFETYQGIAGTAISGLLNSPKYPDSPDLIAYVSQMTSRLIYTDANAVDNYGGRLSGWLVPKETAEYEFFVRSDDGGQLSLSIDEDPANAVVIASESTCCGPFEEPGAPETSVPIALEAGHRYYIQALWKEGTGGDYCDVAWRKVGDTLAAKFLPYIPGNVLETVAAPGTFTPPTVVFTEPSAGSAFGVGVPITLTVNPTAAADKQITKVEFYELGKLLATATNSPFSLVILGATADNHTYIARATDSAGIFADSAPFSLSVGDEVEPVTLAAIDDKTVWSYDRSGQDLGSDWREPGYDDSAWPTGKALIADETTTTVEPIRTPISRFNDAGKYVTTFYFRTHFNFNRNVSPSVKLRLRHALDDGAIFYLNGQRIHKFGLPDGDITAATLATSHENAWEGPFEIPTDALVTGDNVLAAEVHQTSTSSSDMVFGAELVATVPVVRVSVTAAAIDDKTTWSYNRSGEDLGSDWRVEGFDDSAWPVGKALIADETTTTVEPIRTPISRFNDAGKYVVTFYFRHHFNLNASSVARARIKLRHAVDDGVIFYLNGERIHKFGLPDGDITAATLATSHENAWEGPYAIPTDFLRAGDNLIAAEVHQTSTSSSDMVFGAEMLISIPDTDLLPDAPKLRIVQDGVHVNISWTAGSGGKLESAPAINGPWKEVPNATNPLSLLSGGTAQFFRIVR